MKDEGTWRIEVFRRGSEWRWKLINRDGDLVMWSREKYPTENSARLAAIYEQSKLKECVVADGAPS